jgi:hypothetical protein
MAVLASTWLLPKQHPLGGCERRLPTRTTRICFGAVGSVGMQSGFMNGEVSSGPATAAAVANAL